MAPLVQHIESLGRNVLEFLQANRNDEKPPAEEATSTEDTVSRSGYKKDTKKRDTRKKADDVTVTINIPGISNFLKDAKTFLVNLTQGTPVEGSGPVPRVKVETGEEPRPWYNVNRLLDDKPWYETKNIVKIITVVGGTLTALKVAVDRIVKGIKVVDQLVALARYFNTNTLPGVIYLVGYAGQAVGLSAKLVWFLVRMGTWPVRICLPTRLYERTGGWFNKVDKFMEGVIKKWNDEVKASAKRFKGTTARFENVGPTDRAGSTDKEPGTGKGREAAKGKGPTKPGTPPPADGDEAEKAPPGDDEQADKSRSEYSMLDEIFRGPVTIFDPVAIPRPVLQPIPVRQANAWAAASYWRQTDFEGFLLQSPARFYQEWKALPQKLAQHTGRTTAEISADLQNLERGLLLNPLDDPPLYRFDMALRSWAVNRYVMEQIQYIGTERTSDIKALSEEQYAVRSQLSRTRNRLEASGHLPKPKPGPALEDFYRGRDPYSGRVIIGGFNLFNPVPLPSLAPLSTPTLVPVPIP